jgi:hypothetical protein
VRGGAPDRCSHLLTGRTPLRKKNNVVLGRAGGVWEARRRGAARRPSSRLGRRSAEVLRRAWVDGHRALARSLDRPATRSSPLLAAVTPSAPHPDPEAPAEHPAQTRGGPGGLRPKMHIPPHPLGPKEAVTERRTGVAFYMERRGCRTGPQGSTAARHRRARPRRLRARRSRRPCRRQTLRQPLRTGKGGAGRGWGASDGVNNLGVGSAATAGAAAQYGDGAAAGQRSVAWET